MKSLPTIEPEESINVLGLPLNSGKQVCSRNDDNSEETDSDPKLQATDEERGKTEFLSDERGLNKKDAAAKDDSSLTEKKLCYQCNGEREESEPAGGERMNALQPQEGGALMSSVKQRLAQLHRSTDFNFSTSLAAQVAARSLTFTAMQEQTFGDEEGEEIQENKEFFEKHKDKGSDYGK